MTKLEIDRKIVASLHNLSLEERKSLLDYSLFLINQKKKPKVKPKTQNFAEFLREFRKEVEAEPLDDIDTTMFDSYRKSVKGRDFKWED